MRARMFLIALGLLAIAQISLADAGSPSGIPASDSKDAITIGNDAMQASWTITSNHLVPESIFVRQDRSTHDTGGHLFALELNDGSVIDGSQLQLVGPPTVGRIAADLAAPRAAERRAGSRISAELVDATGNLHAHWEAIARDDSNYLRETLSIEASKSAIPLKLLTMIDWPLRFPVVMGTARGVPIISGDLFCMLETPLADSTLEEGRAHAAVRVQGLAVGETLNLSAVVGVARPGQLRRDFLAYVESERPRPYRPMLHYNGWFDLGTPIIAKDAYASIDAIGNELAAKRDVAIDSFLLDDGWDNPNTVWDFSKQFPDGFAPLKTLASKYGAGAGVWLSPWGGYASAFPLRVAAGHRAGYDAGNRFTLCDPKYAERFRQVCLDFVTTYGVNLFKLDGASGAPTNIPNSKFDCDFDAAVPILDDLRRQSPALFVNMTTGTWPSPAFLRYADSIWRGGADTSYAGVGSYRQRWITYRDGETYRNVVIASPLFPLNSLMVHGIVLARGAGELSKESGSDFDEDVHAYFGSGTQLQELYLSPKLLSQHDWDTLAESARWSRANADTLVDTHWIGGDPLHGDVYGWAAWSPRHAIITLRNPSDRAATYSLDVDSAFELPAGAPTAYKAHIPWATDAAFSSIEFHAGQPQAIHLAPFEVLVLDALPLESQGKP